MLAAALIFLATLFLVIVQPRGLGIGWSASLGAAAALLSGVVQPGDIPEVWKIIWNATFSLIAAVIISLLLDEAGFFTWAALQVARLGRGNGRWLFTFLVLLGAVITALFNNDGAILILTPIVVSMLQALRLSPGATLAYVMAVGFIADTASLPLVVSNLVNIVSADFFDLGFAEYARVMLPVNLASVLTSLGILLWFFRHHIPAQYPLENLPSPHQAIHDPATFRTGWAVLALLLLGFFGLEPLGIPVSAVATSGAVLLWAVAARGSQISTRRVLRTAPWQVVVFSLGMYLVVYGLRNEGLSQYLVHWLEYLASGGVWTATLGTGFTAAFLSSVMNNLPAVLLGALSIEGSQVTGSVREAMIYANVVGSDLGPKITPIGSLATLLWLHLLAGKSIQIGWGYYFRVGLVLTLPVLLITLSVLAWVLA